MPQPNLQTGQRDRTSDSARTPERTTERATERLHRPSDLSMSDPRALDETLIPRGVTMEWKRTALVGMADKRNQVISYRNHWKPVPHSMQPHFLGHLESDPNAPIIIEGLQLMMRPTYLVDDANKEYSDNTTYQLAQQLEGLRSNSIAHVGPKGTQIKRSFVAPPGAAAEVVE